MKATLKSILNATWKVGLGLIGAVMVDDILVYIVDGWEGLMDARTGRIITPACYWDIKMASKDLLLAKLGYSNEGVILDKNGRIIK